MDQRDEHFQPYYRSVLEYDKVESVSSERFHANVDVSLGGKRRQKRKSRNLEFRQEEDIWAYNEVTKAHLTLIGSLAQVRQAISQ